MLTQVAVTFAVVCVLWVVYGYSLAFGPAAASSAARLVMLKNIEMTYYGVVLSVHSRGIPGPLCLYHRPALSLARWRSVFASPQC
ncbi:hypothetical protein ACLK1Y_02500 [Escherichia coli]